MAVTERNFQESKMVGGGEETSFNLSSCENYFRWILTPKNVPLQSICIYNTHLKTDYA